MPTRFLLPMAMLLAGCAVQHEQPQLRPVVSVDPVPPPPAWRGIAREQDQVAIEALPQRWAEARTAAGRRFATRLRLEGPLLDPAAALPLPALSPGRYTCRLVRLGGQVGYATYKPDTCQVDGDDKRQSLTKQNGTTLPGGWLYADAAPTRLVFLGASRSSATEVAPGYGTIAGRDVSGVIERVDAFRWRLVLTNPAGKHGALEIYELVPIAPDMPARVMARDGAPIRSRNGEARPALVNYAS